MFSPKRLISIAALAAAVSGLPTGELQAQSCLNIFGWGKSASTVPTNPAVAPNYAYTAGYPVLPSTYVGAPVVGGVTPGGVAGQQYYAGYAGLPQSNLSLAAPTNYNTQYFNVPTTYYRPVTTTDPRTGKQVTTMMPCTSYQMQALRSPAWGLGGWLQGGNQVPMVASPPLPAATASPGMFPQTNVTANSAVQNGTYSSATTPTINPTLPVYGNATAGGIGTSTQGPVTSVQPAYGAANGAATTAYYPGTVVSPYNVPTGTATGATGNIYPPSGFTGGTSSLPTTGIQYPDNSQVYPSATYPPTPSTTLIYPPDSGTTIPQASTSSQYPSIESGSRLDVGPMYSAKPESTTNPAVKQDEEANVKPILPATENAPIKSEASETENKSSSNSDELKRIQNVVRQPSPDLRDMSSRSIDRVGVQGPSTESSSQNNKLESIYKDSGKPKLPLTPSLKPIPLPSDFNAEPQWNPSLLNSSDKTATIESQKNIKTVDANSRKPMGQSLVAEDVRYASFEDRSNNSSDSSMVESGKRAILSTTNRAKAPSPNRYDDSGWKSSRGR